MDNKFPQYIDQELAEAHIFPHGLTHEEKKKADEEMRAFRMKVLEEMTEEQKVFSKELRQKYLKEGELRAQ